jgi:hypothetical protein
MDEQKRAMASGEQRQQGADLIFLSEFPIGILSDRPPEVKSVAFELKQTARRAAKRWIIDAAERFGLPNYVDMQLFVALLALTRQQDFADQVRFCRNQVLRDLGWPVNQQSYDRIQLGLNRMVATTYTAINHYPDPKGRACVRQVAFHLMERYEIHDSRFADAELPPSWFRWSDDIRLLLQTRQLKTLDLEVFRTLKRPVSQAMYRYLHTRHLDGKAAFEENLVEYACERLGLSRDFRWASDLKRTLNEGHRELIEKGLIARANYERMRTEKGERPQQKVVIQFSRAAPAWVTSTMPCALPVTSDGSLADQLVQQGVTQPVAVQLAGRYPEECERQLEYLPYRDARNPAGVLRRAIEEQWPPPPRWNDAQQQQARIRTVQRRRRADTERRRQFESDEAAFDTWWAALPQDQQQALTEQAKAELMGESPTVALYYQRRPESLPKALRPLLMQRMRQ